MVTFNILVDGKSEVVNFYNIFYTSDLKYNFLSVDIIEKACYSIQSGQNRKNDSLW